MGQLYQILLEYLNKALNEREVTRKELIEYGFGNDIIENCVLEKLIAERDGHYTITPTGYESLQKIRSSSMTHLNHIKTKKEPMISISHIAEEKKVAIEFKNLIENSFSKRIVVFVSSDYESISFGELWFEKISKALEKCNLMVIMCSSKSINKPWINFETGSAWISKIPIIPLCHSGLKPSDLPFPLMLLQAAIATNKCQLEKIFTDFTKYFGLSKPKVDFQDFISRIKDFENKYSFWDEVNRSFTEIGSFDTRIIEGLKSHKNIQIELLESDANSLKFFFGLLENRNILRLEKAVGNEAFSKITTSGMYINYKIAILPEFDRATKDKNFVYYKNFSK